MFKCGHIYLAKTFAFTWLVIIMLINCIFIFTICQGIKIVTHITVLAVRSYKINIVAALVFYKLPGCTTPNNVVSFTVTVLNVVDAYVM